MNEEKHNMTWSSHELVSFVVTIAIICSVITWCLTDITVSGRLQSQAVTKGYAHWEPSPSTGENVFKWNN